MYIFTDKSIIAAGDELYRIVNRFIVGITTYPAHARSIAELYMKIKAGSAVFVYVIRKEFSAGGKPEYFLSLRN